MRGPVSSRREVRESYFADVDRRLGAAHLPTIDRWTDLLEFAGFDLIDVRGYLSIRQLRRWEQLSPGRKSKRPGDGDAAEPSRLPSMRSRQLAKPLRFLSHPAAWITAYGVIDDVVVNPYEAAGWLILAMRR